MYRKYRIFGWSFIIYSLILLSCGEANRLKIVPDILGIFAASGPNLGYNYPEVLATYPPNLTLNVPVNSNFVIVFNEPVDATTFSANIVITTFPPLVTLTYGVDYNIFPIVGTSSTAQITFTSLLPAINTVTVTIGIGIQDPGGIPLQAPVVSVFTTGTAPDITAPVRFIGSETPIGGGQALTPAISIDFTEANQLDPSTLNSSNFFLSAGGVEFPTVNPSTNPLLLALVAPSRWRASLTVAPNRLAPGTLYRVDVVGGPNGVKDLSGNFLAASFNWTFTTTAIPADPFGGLPSITGTDPLTVDSVDNTNGYVTWATTKPTSYTLRFGRGDTTPVSVSSPPLDFETFRSVTLNPLTAGKRYWIWLKGIPNPPADYFDVLGNLGQNTNGPLGPNNPFQFNTTTDDTLAPLQLTTVAGGAGNQSTINTVSQAGAPQGVFVFWTDDNSPFPQLHLFGQRYNSGLAAQWGAGGIPVFSRTVPATNYSFLHAVDDGAQGVILLASDGVGIFGKRLDSFGNFVNWEVGPPTSATTQGLQIVALGSNGRAAPVNAGLNRVLYVWRDPAVTVNAKINAIAAGAAAVLAEFILDDVDAGTNPLLISDSNNGAIVGYTRAGNNYGHRIDGNGQIYWGTQSGHTGSVNLTSGTGTPVLFPGTNDMNAGGNHNNWATTNETFDINPNGTGWTTITLNTDCNTQALVITEINTELGVLGVDFQAYADVGGAVGIRTVAIGAGPSNTQCFALRYGAPNNALATLGITENLVNVCGTGVDWNLNNETLILDVDGLLSKTITLNTRCETLAQVQVEVDGKLTAAYAADPYKMVEAVSIAPNLQLQTLSTGRRRLNITGGTALGTLGMLPAGATYRNGTALTVSAGGGDSLVDLQSDNVTGAVYMYKTPGPNLIVQRIDNVGVSQWTNPILINTASSQEVMVCIGSPATDVIAAVNLGNDIWARRVGTSFPWAGTFISNVVGGGNQMFPRIFPNGANTIITWEDDRFLYPPNASVGYSHNTGWGVFGMKINAATGVKDPAWNANTVGAADQNGVAVILNNTLFGSPKAKVAPYFGGSQAIVLWEDNRAFQGSDVLFIDLNGFVP